MKIGIDARPLMKKKAGIGYYLYYLLENILKFDTKNEYILFSDRKIIFDIKNYRNVKVIEDTESYLKKTFWYAFKLDSLCKKEKIDVFWGTQHVLPFGLKSVKKILTIHDCVAFDLPKTMNFINRIINKLLIPNSVKKSDKIIAVSNSTKERLIYNFAESISNKIDVIYEDVIICSNYSDIKEEYLASLGLEEKKYVMFLGTIEPRKNLKTLLKAFEIIEKEINIKLVLCGKYGWNFNDEKGIIESNKDKIVFLNYVEDYEKNYLMSKSFLFIFPSMYEGFGLPVLEAMKNNAVVMVAKNTSLKELIVNERLNFSTYDSEELAEKVIYLYKNKKIYHDAYEYCQKRKKDFNWNDIARQYINLFDNI